MDIIRQIRKLDTRPPKAEPIKGDLPFTLKDIRAAVPPELFKADIPTSWYYILRDFTAFGLTAYVAYVLLSLTTSSWLRALIWIAHAVVQGTTGFGLWVIGHECGHQGYFGDGHWLNDPVGLVLHSAFCDPYHSWRITHGTHHRFTNNKERDTAFPPKDQPIALYEASEYFPPLNLVLVGMYILFGWPLYINGNLEGHRYEDYQNHWNPNAPMFQKKDRMDVIVSCVGVAVMVSILASFASTYGAWAVFLWYGLPWVATHSWLVIVTFLQHSDRRVPHYPDDESFDFVKGAIATVDRDYGAVINNMLHHITNAHLVHHVFSRIPFYQALKATPYVKALLGKHYIYDDRNLVVQFADAWYSHQSSFYHSPKWQARFPEKKASVWPFPKKQPAH